MSVATTARARVRAELSREILDAARRNLIQNGPQHLSLRAIARELGMAPSGLYRYYAGRDELLTALIVDSYASIGAAATEADRSQPAEDHLGRWLAVADATWTWGHDHPQEWALVYGSPVPDYSAPEETIEVAQIVILVMTGIIDDAREAGRLAEAAHPVADEAALAPTLTGVQSIFRGGIDQAHLVATLAAWSQVFGLTSLFLFGHLEGGVEPAEVLWRQLMENHARDIGLRPLERPV